MRGGTCGDPLHLKERLAFVGDKSAGETALTAREVVSGLCMKTVGMRYEELMNLGRI